ncbi:MAG: flagellin [Acetobacter sp.]
MSTSIGQYGASAANLVLSAGVQELTNAQTTLAWQTSSNGISSETFAGLGSSRSSVFNLTPKITQVQAWQTNITNAQNSLTVTATALKQIVSLAQSMATNLLSIAGTTEASTVSTVSTEASSTLSQIATVLNTSNGTGYVFAGKTATEAPVKDPSNVATSTTSTDVASQLTSILSSGGTTQDVLTEATKLMNADNSIFSDTISTASSTDGTASLNTAKNQATQTITGDGTTSVYGIVATQGSSATSAASDTSTGSPIKDLMRDMMLISGMNGMSSNSTGYSDFVNQLHTSLVNTTNELINMETTVGAQQNALTARSTLLTNTTTALTTQLDNARTTDIAQVAIQSTNVQTSLKASFMLIADLKDMTLANYL